MWSDKPTSGEIVSGGASGSIPGLNAGMGGAIYGEFSYTEILIEGNIIDMTADIVKAFTNHLKDLGKSLESLGLTTGDVEAMITDFYKNNVSSSTATSTGSVGGAAGSSNDASTTSNSGSDSNDDTQSVTSSDDSNGG